MGELQVKKQPKKYDVVIVGSVQVVEWRLYIGQCGFKSLHA